MIEVGDLSQKYLNGVDFNFEQDALILYLFPLEQKCACKKTTCESS